MSSPARSLRALLQEPGFIVMPCCFDALSARLIEQAGFPLTFMSGFAVSAARLACPDTGLISYGEMVDQGRNICEAVKIPVIGDGDTGYGNPVNVKRTVHGYASAGFACVMIEDQQAPKRCGHTRGKQVVERSEALVRMRAALDAQAEVQAAGGDILILARTDAHATHGLEEAIERARRFAGMGADIAFVEAPRSVGDLERIGEAVPGPKLVNLVEDGDTPLLSPPAFEALGFKIAAHPLTLLSAAAGAMRDALAALRAHQPCEGLLPFHDLQEIVGFPQYDEELARYDLAGEDGSGPDTPE